VKKSKKTSFVCDICGYDLWDDYQIIGLVKCAICGLVRAQLSLDENTLKKYYKKNYFFGDEYSDYFAERKALERNFESRLTKLDHYIDVNKSKIIEVGCAYGFFLKMLDDRGAKAIGYDVSRDAIKYAKQILKLDARLNDFVRSKDHNVDCVCMWDVIEHLPNPGEVVAKAGSILKKGGILTLTTGDIGSLLAQIQGRNWRLIHPPTHMFYFDRQTIGKLLRMYDLDIVEINYPSISRNVGTVIQKVFKPRGFAWFNNLQLTLNLHDIMEVIAQKR